MPLFARSAALRSAALSMSLTASLAASVAAQSGDAWAKDKVPLPKARPISRNTVPKTSSGNGTRDTAASDAKTKVDPRAELKPETRNPAARDAGSSATASIPPAPRQHAALPLPRKPVLPAAEDATSSTPQGEKDTHENMKELVRKHKPDDATQVESGISDPVARKLAEWIILRSDNNNASVERYRAFISANPSWPSQTFMRRRLEAALWDDKRDDSVVWSWFENESPLSAKGRFSLARAMLARGARAPAARPARQGRSKEAKNEETENNAQGQ